MMKFPMVNDVSLQSMTIDTFYGINRRSVISAGEFADSMNMTNDMYPCIGVREKHFYYEKDSKACKALFYNEKLGMICSNASIKYNGAEYELPFEHNLDLVSTANMGRRVFINNAGSDFGESCVFDLTDLSVRKIAEKFTVANETNGSDTTPRITGGDYCHVLVYFEDGKVITSLGGCKTAEELEQTAAISTHAGCLVRLGDVSDNCTWHRVLNDATTQSVDKLRYRFCAKGIGNKFKTGDYVKITLTGAFGINPDLEENLKEFDGWYEIANSADWYIEIIASPISWSFLNAAISKRGSEQTVDNLNEVNGVYFADGMTIERPCPELKYICENDNRIWGCTLDNQIMCCELGRPFNWYRYEKNYTDSWASSVGTGGVWTGAITYNNVPIFFKNNIMYQIGGSLPSSYTIQEYSCRGAINNSSLCVVNDILFYMASDGIYVYSGSTPRCISDKVFKSSWTMGVAGRYNNKYVISILDNIYDSISEGEKHRQLYVYDTLYGTWQREDDINMIAMTDNGTLLYASEIQYGDGVEYTTRYNIHSWGGGNLPNDDNIEWYAETGPLASGVSGKNYVRKIEIEAMVDEYSEMGVFIQYDNSGRWIPCKNWKEQKRRTVNTHIVPRRSDNVRLRFEGIGYCEIYSIGLYLTKGSDKK